ncbi:TetR/AcrR family transcriptional regulator [Micromonospora sp. NPDC004704]
MGRARTTGATGAVDPETLWLPPTGTRLGRRPTHSRAEITAAAVTIADTEGLTALTMRRLATEVAAGAMSLYTYVPDKETLLELMIDQVAGEHDLPPPGDDWRDDLRRLAHVQRDIMRRHPWLPSALASRQTLGPNTLASLEYALTALQPTNLDGQQKMEAFALLTGFVASYVSNEVAQELNSRRTGRDPQEALAAQGRYLHTVVRSGAYPRLAEVLGTISGGTVSSFDRLLDQLLNGLVPVG